VDPRARLDDVERRKFFPLSEQELRPLGRPARNQLLYRLSYPGLRTLYNISLKQCKAVKSVVITCADGQCDINAHYETGLWYEIQS
jgi:hypothetical protein